MAKKDKAAEKPAKETKKKKSASSEFFDPSSELDATLNSTEKAFGMQSSSLARDDERMSTGLIALDMVIGGGIVGGGWYTVSGGEQSCKSTLAMQISAVCTNEILRRKRKMAALVFDYEGSSDQDYIGQQMKTLGLTGDSSTMFGVKDDVSGEYIVQPIVRYYSLDVGEDFFRYMGKIKRALPNLEKHGKDWYYVYEHTKQNKSKLSGFYDAKYLSKNNVLRVPAPDGFMQAIAVVDSYPAMLPERLDADDKDGAMAEQARMFSDGIRKFRGGMRKKKITVIGVNQVRERPATMFGNPEYEPCGSALKFYSDVRIKNTSRASVPFSGFKIDKGIVEEDSLDVPGGKDMYRFISMKTVKNKLGGIPNRETWARLWISDANGQARGFDPVFDTWYYMKELGLITGTINKISFSAETPFGDLKPISWKDFKFLILGSKSDITEWCTKHKVKAGSIRAWCKKHCSSGKGPTAYVESVVRGANNLREEASDDDDE